MKLFKISLIIIGLSIIGGCSNVHNVNESIKDFNLDLIPCEFRTNRQENYVYKNMAGEYMFEFKALSYNHPKLNLFYKAKAFISVSDFKGFIDTNGNELFSLEGKPNDYMTEGIVFTRNDNKTVSAYDTEGNEVFSIYGLACSPLREGYALFCDRNGKMGIIDSKGEIVFEPSDEEYVYIWSDLSSIAAMAHPTYYLIAQKDGLPYILDIKTGKRYLDECIPDDVYNWQPLNVDYNNLVVAKNKEGLYGILDLEGNWVVDPDYTYLVNDGEWYIFKEEGNSLMGWMDKNGEVKIEPIAKPSNYSHWIGFGYDNWSYIGDGSFIDRDGNIVLETDYDINSNFIGDRCLVDKHRQGYVWINRQGEEISESFFPTENAIEDIRNLSIGGSPQYKMPLF